MNGFMTLIPSGKTGEKYVKLITGDPDMTVKRYAHIVHERGLENQKLIEDVETGRIFKKKLLERNT